MHRSETASLFDHLIGAGEEHWRNVEAYPLSCREGEDELELAGTPGQTSKLVKEFFCPGKLWSAGVQTDAIVSKDRTCPKYWPA